MRSDAIGFFWVDEQREVRQRGATGHKSSKEKKPKGERTTARVPTGTVPRSMPPIPNTGWVTPDSFPRLDSAKIIAIDTETRDPCLLELGPGVRRDGHMVGISVGTEDGHRWYFPFGHEYGGGNLDKAAVIRWAKEELTRPGQLKVGANLSYDLDYLAEEGVHVQGPFFDVQIAEPLIDENARSYSLENLAIKHLGEHKVDEELYKWSANAYGGKPTRRQQAGNIYRCPVALVGPYAEGDADLPLRIREKQIKLLESEHLLHISDIEHRLIPLLLAMRRRGVRLDMAKAQRIDDDLSARIIRDELALERAAGGRKININSGDDIAVLFDRLGIEYPRTRTGKPSFTAQWLERHEHPITTIIKDLRKWYKARDTFIRGYVFKYAINGRIHCQFNQLKGDEYGTVSGRFSSSLPNLQNIPARDEEIGPMIRSLFIPEDGEDWVCDDWSQIEYRLLVHYAMGESGEAARQQYRDDPSTDFHVYCADITGLDRKPAKGINFGLVYGMGKPHLAESLGRTIAEAEPIFKKYHSSLPFVKETFDAVSEVAGRRGWIKTFMGRRARFHLFESAVYQKDKKREDMEALTEESAKARKEAGDAQWKKYRRAFLHKALNRLLQGSAADIMKAAMVQIWESGVCDVIGAPLLTVHDELDSSVPRTAEGRDAKAEIKRIMENTVKLKVPLKVDEEVGPNWSEVE